MQYRKLDSSDINALVAVREPVKQLASERTLSVEHIVLAWTLQQTGVSHVLAGARTAAQAKHNAKAGLVELNESELQLISAAAATWKGFVT